jgi:hypothetical protein
VISPTAQHTAETISHALNIADRLVDDATWLHQEAYWPRGRDRDRPTRAYALDPRNPDAVPGERWDLGLATDAVIRAYHESGALVANAERLAADAVLRAAGNTPLPATPKAPVVGAAYVDAVAITVGRLDVITHYGVDRLRSDAMALTWSAASHLIEAHAPLRAAMPNPDGIPDPIAAKRCRTCRNPHTEPGKGDRSECAACRMYRSRHGGQPRPYRRNADALRAKDRRLERGEDHGCEDGGIQAGTYRGNVWVPHTAMS